VAAFLVPLDVTIRPYDLLTKYVDGRLVQARIGDGIWAAHPFLHVAMNALVATPLGVLAVVGWTPHPRRVRQAMTLGFLALCGLGFAQVFVMSRSTDLLALLVGFCGLALGAAIARTFAPPLESGPPVKM
jgi:glycopeptide antibiotics resistance protein